VRCIKARARLNDYVDGLLAESDAAAVAQHLGECGDCRSEEEALRRILQQAHELPREIAPPRELWDRIANKISGHEEAALTRPRSASRARLLAKMAMVVLFLMVISAGLAVRMSRNTSRDVSAPAIGYGDCEEALQECAQARAALLADLDEHKAKLSPKTLTTVNDNLRVIDKAITDIKNALKGDPENSRLKELLVHTYAKQVQFLAEVARLVNHA